MAGVTPVELQTGETRSVRLEVAGHSLALAQDPSSGNHGHVVWDAAGDLAKYLLEGSKRRDVSVARLGPRDDSSRMHAAFGMPLTHMCLSGWLASQRDRDVEASAAAGSVECSQLRERAAPTLASTAAGFVACCVFVFEQVRGKRVVEVGSGTGAAGLLLAMAGATVALTDLPSVVPLLAANAARVLGSARVRIHRGDGAAECGDDDESPAHRSGSHAPETGETATTAEAAFGAVGGGDDSWGSVDVGPWDFGKDPPSFVLRLAEPHTIPRVSAHRGAASCAAAEPAADATMPDDGRAADGSATASGAAATAAGPEAAASGASPSNGVAKQLWPHFIVGSDVLYAESLIDPLLRGVESLMGPSTVAILANERRCEDTFDAFVRACKDRFRVRAVPRKQMPAEAPESMYILELRLKRHR